MGLSGDLVEARRAHTHRERSLPGEEGCGRGHPNRLIAVADMGPVAFAATTRAPVGCFAPGRTGSEEVGVATGGKDREARAARERARLYQARQDLHAAHIRRRGRDSIIAAIVGGLIILAAVGSQIVYATLGPGAPAPTESTPAPTESSSPAAPVDETPSPTTTP